MPHFFIYAKGKLKDNVEELSNCNIDRISNVVKSNRIVFKDLLGKYSYKVLMNNPHIDIKSEKAQEIINLYREIENVNLRKLSHTDWDNIDFWEQKKVYLQIQFDSNKQRKLFTDLIGMPEEYISDVLVKALQDDVNKDTLWRLFGEIIYHNIEVNLNGTKICKKCGNRFQYDPSSIGKPNSLCTNCRNQNQLEKYKKYNQNR